MWHKAFSPIIGFSTVEMSRKSLSDVSTLLFLLPDSRLEPRGRNVGLEVYFCNYFVTLIIYCGVMKRFRPMGEIGIGQLIYLTWGRDEVAAFRTERTRGNYGNLLTGSIFFFTNVGCRAGKKERSK